MRDLFWVAYDRMPDGVGFGMFTPTHWSVLILLGLLSAYLIHRYKYSDNRARFRQVMGVTVVTMEALRQIIEAVTRQWTVDDMPLHLCGIGLFIVLWDSLKSNKFSQEILYSLTLPGAFMALITPDWVTSPLFNYFSWHSFLVHTLLVTYVLMRLLTGEIKPDFSEIWRPSLFLVIILPLIFGINQWLSTNFFFLSVPVPGSPLEMVADIFGNWYVLGMILLLMIVWILLYLPWYVASRKQGRLVSR